MIKYNEYLNNKLQFCNELYNEICNLLRIKYSNKP